ncbi:MAG: GPW/gp25 family protein [Bacteroidota bacterium]
MLYKIPVDFHYFFQKAGIGKSVKQARLSPEFEKLPTLKASIDDFIDLLVFTHPGECKFAYDFGFSFWETEFSNLTVERFNNSEYPRKRYEENLKETIQKYEPNLTDVKVEILLSDDELMINRLKISFFVVIVVHGFIKGIRKEPYRKNIVFSLGPVIKK